MRQTRANFINSCQDAGGGDFSVKTELSALFGSFCAERSKRTLPLPRIPGCPDFLTSGTSVPRGAFWRQRFENPKLLVCVRAGGWVGHRKAELAKWPREGGDFGGGSEEFGKSLKHN